MRPFATAAPRRARPVAHLRPVSRAVLVTALFAIAALTSPLASPASGQSPSLEPPSKPTGLTGEVAHDRVELTWDDPGDASISGYRVLRRDPEVDASGVFTTLIDNTGSALPAYVDREVQPEKRYIYRIQARNAAGLSPRSRRFVADTPAAPVVQSERGVQPLVAHAQQTCPGTEDSPEPVAVPVTAVPIVVTSTTDEYFVLYVTFDVDGTELRLPVAVTLGGAATTPLSENVEALPAERYRVEKYLIADPADVDGDCIDDITELSDPLGMSPVNATPPVDFSDGAVSMPDLETYVEMSQLGDTEVHSKVVVLDPGSERPGFVFINAKTHETHQRFLDAMGIERPSLSGSLSFNSQLMAPGGSRGAWYIWFSSHLTFATTERIYALVAANMPALRDDLYVYVPAYKEDEFENQREQYEASRIDVVFWEDLSPPTRVDLLNPGVGYGQLRIMDPDDRPHPRDVVIYETVPNELPRVAGIITTVRQTPLSHVNLRAAQDGVPNAYVRDVLKDPAVAALEGGFVRYEVTATGWSLRAATPGEVDEHYESSRPPQAQTPQRDLSVRSITPLSDVRFADWEAFGVKAANVAELGRLGFAEGTVPDGFAIPFYFYDEFMKANGFHDRIEQMLADPGFQSDFDIRDDLLDDLRDDIEDAASPQWIIDALTEMHASFPEGTSLRYRSSTNNEDLPGFNGAGLYDSKTQDPEETEEDGIDKSLKGVFASLWNFRAFSERDFHRIDHGAAAMGVLVHPNYSDELANGVAVSFDPFYDGPGRYYVNTQLGEDLITNPLPRSVPEELLLLPDGNYLVRSTSNLVGRGELLMSDAQLVQLAQHLTTIHEHFEALYKPGPGEPFAMEIEFKITSDDILAIKQARPWVFSTSPTTTTTTTTTTTGGGGGGGGPSGPSPSKLDFEWTVKHDIDELDVGHGSPSGMWSDGATLWLAENGDGADDAVYAYDLKSGERGEDREFELDETNRAPRGVWSDRTLLWVSDSGRNRLFAHDLATGERLPERDLELAERNRDARGIWSDEVTMWVLDGVKDSLFAYDLGSGALLAEYALDSANDDPHGLWSDGVTLWVSDHGEKRLFAYRLAGAEASGRGNGLEREPLDLERSSPTTSLGN